MLRTTLGLGIFGILGKAEIAIHSLISVSFWWMSYVCPDAR
jgi:hypothetical protein